MKLKGRTTIELTVRKMVPRAVLMKQEISSIIGEFEAFLGNVIGPQGFGWSNLHSRWFLNGPFTLGRPLVSSYFIHHFENGTPFFIQPPVRKNSGTGSFLHPVADSSLVPPVANLFEGYLTSLSTTKGNWSE